MIRSGTNVGATDGSILKWRSHRLRAGGACCSACAATGGHCGETGPPIGPAHTHTHKTFGSGTLGDVTCDQDNNCYDSSTGIYTPAPVFNAAAGIGPNVNSAMTWLSQNSTMLVGLGALVGVLALVGGGSGRRR